MTAATAGSSRRVSRRDLAVYRPIWITIGCMYALIGVAALVMVSTLSGLPVHRYQAAAAWCLFIAVVHLRSEPPAIGTWRNHVVLACVWLTVGMGLWASQPSGGLALGGAIFIGPLTAFRLENPRHIATHIGLFSALMFVICGAGIFFGFVDWVTVLVAGFIGLATPVQALSTLAIFDAAEAQGRELERLVRRDPLTGVGNRRMLDERLEDEIARHERTGRQLSLIALDLNGFKALNDSVGHAAGDELLMEVAAKLLSVAAGREDVVRQGGDEFCLILPETSPEHAQRAVNAIRAALAEIETDLPGQVVSSGFGIASFPDDALTADVLLHVADDRLRASKPTTRGAATPAAPAKRLQA